MPGALVMQAILMVSILAMAVLALVYLQRRQMPWATYCFWGLVAITLPVLGPFLVIAARPGRFKSGD
jgi:hypothetical protein